MEGRRDVAEQNQKKKPEMWALLRPEADDDAEQHEDKQDEQTQENEEPQQEDKEPQQQDKQG